MCTGHMLIKSESSCSFHLDDWTFLLSKSTMKIKTDSHSQNLKFRTFSKINEYVIFKYLIYFSLLLLGVLYICVLEQNRVLL